MDSKVSSFFTGVLFFSFFSFLAVHYTYMKSPAQDRGIASQYKTVRPWYDASWKI